jgi:FAD/FMN-containing dehydrogenase
MTLQTSSPIQSFEGQELESLRARLSGQVLTPQDADYDIARQTWNLTVNQHPALIVLAKTSKDVAEAIRFAEARDLGVAVKAAGHGTLRAADGSLLIVTSQMTDVIVNAAAGTAWISAGAKWGRVEQTQALGVGLCLIIT